jgi:inhibitor of KinA
MSITLHQFAQSCLLISWENSINPKTSREIYHFNNAISNTFTNQIIDSVPSYCSLTLYFKGTVKIKSLIHQLLSLYHNTDFSADIQSHHWNIPVCYHPTLGIDLLSLSNILNLSINDIITLHCRPTYTVDFIGFLPGFPYLNGLDTRLHSPRLSSPRDLVQKGSVAIGGKQTGIYPVASPAGWNIIGRTNFELFNAKNIKPCLISPMDTLQFIPITLSEFNNKTND